MLRFANLVVVRSTLVQWFILPYACDVVDAERQSLYVGCMAQLMAWAGYTTPTVVVSERAVHEYCHSTGQVVTVLAKQLCHLWCFWGRQVTDWLSWLLCRQCTLLCYPTACRARCPTLATSLVKPLL